MPSHAADLVNGHRAVKVTPADTDLPEGVARGLWIGIEGSITVMFQDGTIGTDMPTQAGLFPFYVKQVMTGTVADDIWAVY